jgi:hypothetical protein
MIHERDTHTPLLEALENADMNIDRDQYESEVLFSMFSAQVVHIVCGRGAAKSKARKKSTIEHRDHCQRSNK